MPLMPRLCTNIIVNILSCRSPYEYREKGTPMKMTWNRKPFLFSSQKRTRPPWWPVTE